MNSISEKEKKLNQTFEKLKSLDSEIKKDQVENKEFERS